MRRTVALSLAAMFGAVALLLGLGTGTAQADGETVFGFLRNGLTPVAGIKITVAGPGGFTASDTTDAKGRWDIKLPKDGTYTVAIDSKALPKGVSLRDKSSQSRKVVVAFGQNKPVLIPLGKDTRKVEGFWTQAAQLAAEGFRFGLIIALAAVGLSLIFGTTGLTNFAHGELVTVGGLLTYWLNTGNLPHFLPNGPKLPFTVAAALTLVVCALLGWANDAGLWAPLRRRGTGLIAAMIVSIGLSILVRYIFLYLFGGSNQSYNAYRGQTGLHIGPLDLAAKDYLSMLVAIVVLMATAYALLRTRIGKATRAVADNPALAAASGIDVDRVIKVVWISGAVLAGLSGILLGLAQGVNFQMGFQILLLIFAAVTLGGLGTAFGALLGSLVVGLFISLSTLWIPIELKNVGALGILIVILLVRPQGILGSAQRVG
ncbi:MAG: branched-chain amino acid transport system permease protein [Actinomycetota bacterium]|nr:branched-chain amino acid transport system permease protein [Actinomycetota bacterium]